MIKRTLITLLIAAALLSACAGAKSALNPPSATGGVAPSLGMPDVAPSANEAGSPQKPAFDSQTEQNITTRLVIRNASLSIIVTDPAAVMDDIMRMANSMGGFVVTSNLYQATKQNQVQVPEAQVTVRVPADQLDAALKQIKAHVKDPVNDVLYENISGQDVTQEYTDLQSRLRNLEAAAKQLQTILDNAVKVDDVLSVYNELRSVNEQIEVLKGQIQYYEQSARLSAISVTIQAEAGVQPVTIGGWQPKGVAKDALQTLIRAYQWIANAAIWIVVFCLPIAIPVGLVLYFIIRGIRKMNQKKKAKKAGVTEVPPAA